MSATEVKSNNNNSVLHNDPSNHMEVSGLGKVSLDKEDAQDSP